MRLGPVGHGALAQSARTERRAVATHACGGGPGPQARALTYNGGDSGGEPADIVIGLHKLLDPCLCEGGAAPVGTGTGTRLAPTLPTAGNTIFC